VGAIKDKAKRAYKLVATNRYGMLPSNIVRQRFSDLKGVPDGFKDGIDDVGYHSYWDTDTYSVGAAPISIQVATPVEFDTDVMLLPIGVGNEVIITEETFKRTSSDYVGHYFRVERHPSSPSATVQFEVRVRVFDTILAEHTTTAAMRKAIKSQIKVSAVRRR
jgi:hypothetical protein